MLDPVAQTTVAVDYAAGGPTITTTVDPTTLWEVDDHLELTMDDGKRFDVIIIGMVPVDKSVSFVQTTTEDAAAGARLIKKLAPTLVGAAYGTPAVDTKTWGYVAFQTIDQSSWYVPVHSLDRILLENALEANDIAELTKIFDVTVI
jgi:hypothetical protein